MMQPSASLEEYHAALAAQMREADLQRQVESVARSLGWLTYHTYSSIRSSPGFPDLVMVRGPRIIYAELKSARGAVTAAQKQWLAALAGAGAETFLWRPIDLLDGTVSAALTATTHQPDGPTP